MAVDDDDVQMTQQAVNIKCPYTSKEVVNICHGLFQMNLTKQDHQAWL